MTKFYEVIKFEIGGLKCDTKSCDWTDSSIKFADYSKWINRGCPECDGNLLTREDYQAVMMLQANTRKANEWCNNWLPKWLLKRLSNGTSIVDIDMDGSGAMRLKRKGSK